jgi:hypothetical protein
MFDGENAERGLAGVCSDAMGDQDARHKIEEGMGFARMKALDSFFNELEAGRKRKERSARYGGGLAGVCSNGREGQGARVCDH